MSVNLPLIKKDWLLAGALYSVGKAIFPPVLIKARVITPHWYRSRSLNHWGCVCAAWWRRLKEGLGFWLCLCWSKSLTERADLGADGEKWVHPQDKLTKILSSHTRTHTRTRTHTHFFSLFLFHIHKCTFWLNNGPVSGVPMGEAVSLIESSILRSPCLLIDSVSLFCLTKRQTFYPAWLWLSQCERLYVCVFFCP